MRTVTGASAPGRTSRSATPALLAAPVATTAHAQPVTPRASAVGWRLVDLDCYEITVAGKVAGYIDIVGTRSVVLRGSRYDRAVEVAQVMGFRRALEIIRDAGEDQ